MGCLIKIKYGEEYHTFDTEQEAKEFIAKNKLDIETSLKINRVDIGQDIINIGHTQHERTVNTIRVINNVSFDEVGKIRAMLPTEDYDTDTYHKYSDAHSMSAFLGGLRNEDGKLLFPKYIFENYLNHIKQHALCREYLIASGKTATEKEISDLQKQIFDGTITETSEIRLRKAAEWYDYMNSKLKIVGLPLNDLGQVLTSIDEEANVTHVQNFITMIMGEFMHKIVELVVRDTKNIESIIFDETNGILQDFLKSYADYKEVPAANKIISALFQNDGKMKQLFPEYLKVANDLIKEIKIKYKRADGTYPEITILSEQNFTADLIDEINGKKKIRGKVDLCVVVDGILHIYDLKLSKKKHDSWDDAKKLKIDYQLSSYKKLAQSLGLHVGTTNVISVHINDNDTIEFDGIYTHHVNGYGDEQLNKLFKPIHKNSPVGFSEQGISQIHDYMERLFQSGSALGRNKLTIDSLAKSLKSKAMFDSSTNTYSIPYFLIDTDGRSKIHHVRKNISPSELDSVVNDLAEKIQNNLVSRSHNLMGTLANDLQAYFIGTMDIKDFKSINQSRDEINRMCALFSKYKGSGAELIFTEEGAQLGMLFIKSPIGIEVIACTEYDPLAPWDITSKQSKLFDSIQGGLSTNTPKSVGAVKIMEAILVLNALNSDLKIADITCMQLTNVKSYKMTNKQMKEYGDFVFDFIQKFDSSVTKNINGTSYTDALEKVMYSFTRFSELSSGIKTFRHNIKTAAIEDLTVKQQSDLSDALNAKTLSEIKSYLSDFSSDDKIVTLEAMRDSLQKEFPTYFDNLDNPIVNEVTTLMYQIELAIASYKSREFITENDIAMLKLSRGAWLSSMDLLPEENVQMINRIVQSDFQKLRDRFGNFRSKCTNQVNKLKQGNNYNGARQMLIGDVTSNYINLFRRDTNTNELLNGDLILKNPWTDKSLQPHQQEFLKFVLYSINKYNKSKLKYKWKSYKDLKPEQFNEVDFLCPLVRTKGMDRFRDTKGGWNTPLLTKAWYSETLRKLTNEAIDLKDTIEGQVEERGKVSDMMESMYNEFASHSDPNVRASLIVNAGGIQAFSMDIESMLYIFTLAQDSKEIFDESTIPAVRSILYTSMFQANITGLNMPNFNQFVKDYMKSAVYGDSLITGEARELFKFIGPAKSAGAAIALSYNIMNLPRELVMGFFTNISRAAFGAYGAETFTMAEYLKAWGIVTGDIPNFIQNVTKIELLNEMYGLSNMSINEIPAQATSNKTGIFALMNRFSTWSLTAPDYFNRMTMFIAQMLHDGTWDAHKLVKDEDGALVLKYDMELDKRFNIFYKYKNTPISQIPEKILPVFNEQAALYEVMYNDFKEESESIMSDTFIKAYTNRQRNSMKSFADMAFGYYDRDTKAAFFKTSIGVLFKQFMAFLSAKKMSYFQVRSNNTARGSYTQLTDTSGKKIWSVNIDGETKIVTDDELNTTYKSYKQFAKPKLAWTGTYMEGIFQSYVNLLRDVGVGSYEALTGKGLDTLKKVRREYLKKGDIRHSNMWQGLYDLLISTLFLSLLRAIFFEDPEVTGISYDQQMKQKSEGFQNFFWVTKSATQDFNIFTSMNSLFLNWEIPSFNIIQSTARNFFRAAGDDNLNIAEAALSGTVNSVGMFRWARPYVENMLEDE